MRKKAVPKVSPRNTTNQNESQPQSSSQTPNITSKTTCELIRPSSLIAVQDTRDISSTLKPKIVDIRRANMDVLFPPPGNSSAKSTSMASASASASTVVEIAPSLLSPPKASVPKRALSPTSQGISTSTPKKLKLAVVSLPRCDSTPKKATSSRPPKEPVTQHRFSFRPRPPGPGKDADSKKIKAPTATVTPSTSKKTKSVPQGGKAKGTVPGKRGPKPKPKPGPVIPSFPPSLVERVILNAVKYGGYNIQCLPPAPKTDEEKRAETLKVFDYYRAEIEEDRVKRLAQNKEKAGAEDEVVEKPKRDLTDFDSYDVLGKRVDLDDGTTKYFIQWKTPGLDDESDSDEDEEELTTQTEATEDNNGSG